MAYCLPERLPVWPITAMGLPLRPAMGIIKRLVNFLLMYLTLSGIFM